MEINGNMFDKENKRGDVTIRDAIKNRASMSSLEIAELTGKRHDHVMRDIETMLERLEITDPNFGGSYKDSTGRTLKCYLLPKRECLILVSGYKIELRARIIDRWQVLEAEVSVPMIPKTTEDFSMAANELVNSDFYQQTGLRGKRLEAILRKGAV